MKKAQTKKSPPRAASRRRAPAKAKKAKPVRRTPASPAVVAEPVLEIRPAAESALPAPVEEIVAAAEPEREFVARAVMAEPDRPGPAARRAIFFDVENTSRAEHIARVIDHLAVDRMGRRTDVVAVGNWKVIGQDTARLLARHGAQLVHSAPSVGVRDWSDLRIAVAAGVWLAGARAGDVMEIVTNDRAFDAVGDVAAGLGIAYRRLSYQGLAGAPASETAEEPARDAGPDGRGRRRRRGRRYGWREGGAPSAPSAHGPREAPAAARPSPAPLPSAPPPPTVVPAAPPVTPELPRTEAGGNGAEPPAAAHTAPHDEIIAIVRELIHRSPGRTVSIDTLANALKSRGFSRTPGSPRLITRLRRIKEITVSRSGMIALVGSGAAAPRAEFEAPAEMPSPTDDLEMPAEAGDERVEEPIALAADRIEPPVGAARADEGLEEEPGDSIGNVAPAAEPAPPPRYRRPYRGDRRRFPTRPQRASA